MGNIKILLGIIGYERWGGLRPAKMWTPDGACFVPLFYGLWIRHKIEDTNVMGEIMHQIYLAIQHFGGKSDILAIIGSYGDTQTDAQILEMLTQWNDKKEGGIK